MVAVYNLEYSKNWVAIRLESLSKDHVMPRVSFSTSSIGSIQHLDCVKFHLVIRIVSGIKTRVGTMH